MLKDNKKVKILTYTPTYYSSQKQADTHFKRAYLYTTSNQKNIKSSNKKLLHKTLLVLHFFLVVKIITKGT